MEVEAVDGARSVRSSPEGAEGVPVAAVIAILLEEGDCRASRRAPAPAPALKPARQPRRLALPARPLSRPAPAAPAAQPPRSGSGAERRPHFASPLAGRIAAEKARSIRHQGQRTERPHRQGTSSQPPGAAPQLPLPLRRPRRAASGGQPVFVAPATRAAHRGRKVIARRMLESATVPHFSHGWISRSTHCWPPPGGQRRGRGTKVSVNDMVIKACAKSLRDHPECNASWTEDEMVLYGAVDISVAVATDRGLITPIVRNADLKGLAQIAAEMKDLAARAKIGKLKLDEFQGGGFTISNLGMFGINSFSAIINPPQAMILAVGMGEERAVARKGQVVVRNMMSCTLAVDHRVVDGAMGAQYLQTLRAYVEQPAAMLV
jgi:pyruvate dehydrogenase E2 component (dihydrolipoamide acetyltransferase)